jgi:hypothetical protein
MLHEPTRILHKRATGENLEKSIQNAMNSDYLQIFCKSRLW